MCFNSNIDAKRRMNVTVVVSSKHLDIFVQTMFINEKSGNLSTPTDEQASVNTPKASSGTVSTTTSIIQPAQNGNTQNHNNSSNAAQGTVQHRGRFSVLFLLQRVSVLGRVRAPSGGVSRLEIGCFCRKTRGNQHFTVNSENCPLRWPCCAKQPRGRAAIGRPYGEGVRRGRAMLAATGWWGRETADG